MKPYALPLAAAIALTAGVASADTERGTITAINPSNGIVALSTGGVYDFDSSTALRGFNVGNEVVIRSVTSGTKIEPVSIAPID